MCCWSCLPLKSCWMYWVVELAQAEADWLGCPGNEQCNKRNLTEDNKLSLNSRLNTVGLPSWRGTLCVSVSPGLLYRQWRTGKEPRRTLPASMSRMRLWYLISGRPTWLHDGEHLDLEAGHCLARATGAFGLPGDAGGAR